jgi:hypothetical protein
MSKRKVYPVPGCFLLGVPAVPMVREDHAALVESGAFSYEPPPQADEPGAGEPEPPEPTEE